MFKGKNEKVIGTIIGAETTIEGKITLPTSLRIDGKVYGEIECNGDVYIGKGGHAEPTIHAKNIYLSGEAKGDIHAKEKVHIQVTGKLSGNVTSQGMIIDDGGIFNGTSTITEQKEPSKKQRKIEQKELKEVSNE